MTTPPTKSIITRNESVQGDIAPQEEIFQDDSNDYDDVIPPVTFTVDAIEGDADAVFPNASLAVLGDEMDSLNLLGLQEEASNEENMNEGCELL